MVAEGASIEVVSLPPSDTSFAACLAGLQRACNPSPWSEVLWEQSLSDPFTTVYLARCDAAGGWCGYLAVRAAAGESEVLDMGVVPMARRRGLARHLLTKAIERLKQSAVDALFLEVRAGNASARALYASFGFTQCGVRAGYYRGPVEDAAVMRLDLGGTS